MAHGNPHQPPTPTTTPTVMQVVLGLDPAVATLINRLIDAIDRNTAAVRTQETQMSALDDDIADLTAKVAAEGDVVASAVTLLTGIPAMIKSAVDAALAAGATPEQLAAITAVGATVDAQKDSLAAAVAATP